MPQCIVHNYYVLASHFHSFVTNESFSQILEELRTNKLFQRGNPITLTTSILYSTHFYNYNAMLLRTCMAPVSEHFY